MIKLATTVNLRRHRIKGFLGERNQYVVSIQTHDLTFYPVEQSGYTSATNGDYLASVWWAKSIADALAVDFVDHTLT